MIEKPLFFITGDPHMSLGFAEIFPNYSLICLNHTPAVDLMLKENLQVFCGEMELEFPVSNTRSLLKNPKCKRFIQTHAGNSDFEFLFFRLNFDPNEVILELDLEGECKVLNVASHVSLNFESKLNLAKNLPSLLGEFSILRVEFLDHKKLTEKFGMRYVIQASLGFAGNSTWFVGSDSELENVRLSLTPSQLVKITPFNEGPTYTLNACLFQEDLWISQPFIQLTGLSGLTTTPGSTVGNVFRQLPNVEIAQPLIELAEQVADRLRGENYLGVFGIDAMIVDQKPILIEVNARLTASVPMMSQLQMIDGQEPLIRMHREAMMGQGHLFTERTPIKGAQIVKRFQSNNESNIYSNCGSLSKSNLQNLTPNYLLNRLNVSEVLILPSPSSDKIGEEILRVQTLDDELLIDNEFELTNFAKMVLGAL